MDSYSEALKTLMVAHKFKRAGLWKYVGPELDKAERQDKRVSSLPDFEELREQLRVLLRRNTIEQCLPLRSIIRIDPGKRGYWDVVE